ncbi:unnamed protein product [Pleuronectes platessa]|uniref:Uncharacterized protein n=1 Tax=Pleuronectes platessa TaxID=8262 RepID=A0A9N7TII5_PLEPL|nr:unnamed protein product [Pleuronectes platessa]
MEQSVLRGGRGEKTEFSFIWGVDETQVQLLPRAATSCTFSRRKLTFTSSLSSGAAVRVSTTFFSQRCEQQLQGPQVFPN